MVFLVESIRIKFKRVFTLSLLYYEFSPISNYSEDLLRRLTVKVFDSKSWNIKGIDFYEIVPPRVVGQQGQLHNLFLLAWLNHLEVEYQPKFLVALRIQEHDSISSLLLWKQLWTEHVLKFLNWSCFHLLQIQSLFSSLNNPNLDQTTTIGVLLR